MNGRVALRAENRRRARDGMGSVPRAAPEWDFGRRAEAWRIGYSAEINGASTDPDDYYCRDNFYRAMRAAFRAGVVAAQMREEGGGA